MNYFFIKYNNKNKITNKNYHLINKSNINKHWSKFHYI